MLACLGIVFFLASPAGAQIVVGLKSAKSEIIPFEAARLSVEITNRSAKPILLATANDAADSWIRFAVTDERGNLMPMTGTIQPIAPIQLRPGQTIEHGIDIGTIYPLSTYGAYSIQASVYCPPDRAFASSKPVRLNVVGAREIWSDAFGVPAGKPGAGTSRIFRLLQLRTMDGLKLYVRLDDRASGRVLACVPIGSSLDLREPTYTIDNDANLHVLFQAGPDMSYHVVIDPSGKPLSKDAYRDGQGTRPNLAAAADNSIGIAGGRIYDPQVEMVKRQSIRRVSERPPGLEKLLGAGGKPAPPPPPENTPAENYQPLRSLGRP